MARSRATIILLVGATTFLVGDGIRRAQAQITIPTLLPTTTTTTPPAAAAPPTTASLIGSLLKPATTTTAAPTTLPPPTTAVPAPSTAIPGNAGGEGDPVPADAGPFPADLAAKMNSVRRSAPRNSNQLVDALMALTDLGVPVEEAMRVGMGRFPVAGRANFAHDWWFPRFGPGWRLHEGTDVFAERGTPLRSPAVGTVRFADGGKGGISIYVTQGDGTYFYLAHLDRRPESLLDGQQVVPGDIIGFVGSSGNAAGGSPHVHFEVHPAIRIVTVGKGRKMVTKAVSAPVQPGTVLPPIDPKPLLDLYLEEPMAQLPAIVARFRASEPAGAPAAPIDSAVPPSVVLANHRTSSGGFVAAGAPLARTPLLGLAFLLMMVVVVLTTVLLPRTRTGLGVPLARNRDWGRRGGRTPPRQRRARRSTLTTGDGPAADDDG